jgi:hypothetical protein
MRRPIAAFLGLSLAFGATRAQAISRSPTGVNVNAQGGTTVYITFGDLDRQSPAEAMWCGQLVPAAPDVGTKCDPAKIFGVLPARYDRSRLNAAGTVYTDIMSIPPSVARRAYQDARSGAESSFFYVRRFTRAGGPDEYVAVTCRLSGGGARVPFSLQDVTLRFEKSVPVLFVRPGDPISPLRAEITYDGTGRLKGRWEVVLPGQEPPTDEDLLTEATLPPERRGTQRRFTEVERFDVFLPPVGRTTLPGPEPKKFPTEVQGRYLVLLRIEASDDKEADSDLAAAGAGQGVVHAGAVAGFAIRPLQYYAGSGAAADRGGEGLQQEAPADNAAIGPGDPIELRWTGPSSAAEVRIELQDSAERPILDAPLKPDVHAYVAPPFLRDKAPDGRFRWRVVALGPDGTVLAQTPWRAARLERASTGP